MPDRAALNDRGHTSTLKSDDTETHALASNHFHIGAAIGPGYQASTWFTGTAPTPEMWNLFGAAVRDYAAAKFTLIDGGPPMPAGPGHGVAPTNSSAEMLSLFLQLCKETGLHAMPGPDWDGGIITAAERESVWGYGMGDEPGPLAYPGLASKSAQVKRLRPTKPQFINLPPIYGCARGVDGRYNNSWAPDATDCLTQYSELQYKCQLLLEIVLKMQR